MPTPPSPLTSDSDLVSLAVTLDGAALAECYALASILIVHAAERLPFARLTFVLTDSPPPATDWRPGAALVVAAGYHERNRPIFSGKLAKLGVRRRDSSSAVLVVEAHGAAALPPFAPADATRAPVLAVTYGLDLIDFDLEENPGAQPAEKIRGTFGFQGSALVTPGDTIAIGGFGVRFDGVVRIGGVAHVIEQGAWRTQALAGTDARWFTALTGS